MYLSYPTRTARDFIFANITSSVIRTSGQHFETPFAIFGPFDNARALINDLTAEVDFGSRNSRGAFRGDDKIGETVYLRCSVETDLCSS